MISSSIFYGYEMIKLETDNAVYPEDYDTFVSPTYPGECRTVNIIPVDKSGKWLCRIIKHNIKLDSIKLFVRPGSNPLKCLMEGGIFLGSLFINDIVSRLTNENTKFYCMVYKGFARNYYIMVDVSDWGIKIPFRIGKEYYCCWCDPDRIPGVETDLTIFNRKLTILNTEIGYGCKNIKIIGKSGLKGEYNNSTQVLCRVGVIPYDIVNGKVFVIMGVTTQRKYSDFGGGVRLKRNESCMDAIERECIEEAGKDNWELIKRSIHNRQGNYVWLANMKDNSSLSLILMTRMDLTKFNPIDENSEMKGYEIISYEELIKHRKNKFHSPIRPFIEYISSPNYLIGHECSFINGEGSVHLRYRDMVFITPPVSYEPYVDLYNIIIPQQIYLPMRGRLYENEESPNGIFI